jgi:hypothetical protein
MFISLGKPRTDLRSGRRALLEHVSHPTVFHGAENKTRAAKSQDFPKKPPQKKFSTKSTTPPPAGAKRASQTIHVTVM